MPGGLTWTGTVSDQARAAAPSGGSFGIGRETAPLGGQGLGRRGSRTPAPPGPGPPSSEPQEGTSRTTRTVVTTHRSARTAAAAPVGSSTPANAPPSSSPAIAADTDSDRRRQPRYVATVRPNFAMLTGPCQAEQGLRPHGVHAAHAPRDREEQARLYLPMRRLRLTTMARPRPVMSRCLVAQGEPQPPIGASTRRTVRLWLISTTRRCQDLRKPPAVSRELFQDPLACPPRTPCRSRGASARRIRAR